MEDKKKWVNPNKPFIAFFDQATLKNQGYIPNYVAMAPSQSPLLHHFREEDKRRWLGGTLKH